MLAKKRLFLQKMNLKDCYRRQDFNQRLDRWTQTLESRPQEKRRPFLQKMTFVEDLR